MKAGLFKNILTMIYIKKYCGNRIFKIKKGPVAPGDAERKGVGESTHFFDMQSRVAPVFFKSVFLSDAERSNFFRQLLKCPIKVASFDYFHEA